MQSSIFIQSSIQDIDNINLYSQMGSEEDVLRILEKDQLEYYHSTDSEDEEEDDQQSSNDEESIVETDTKNQQVQPVSFKIEYKKKRKFWHTNQWKVMQKESRFFIGLRYNNNNRK